MASNFLQTTKKIIQLSSIKFKTPGLNSIFTPDFTKFELTSTKAGTNDGTASECLRSLWPFLRFARLLGICPVLHENNNIIIKKLNPYWIFTIIAFSIQAVMLSHAFKSLYEQLKTSDGWVEPFNELIYYAHTFGNTIFVFWKVKEFPKFFVECKKIELLLKKYKNTMKDDKLIRDCAILYGIFCAAQFGGDLLYYYSIAAKANAKSAKEFFLAFNYDYLGEWGGYGKAAFLCLAEYYCNMGWTYGDILLSLISVILARYFIRLNKEISVRGNNAIDSIDEIRADHRTITNLVQYCNSIFSPLVLFTYIFNIVYLLTRLYTGVGHDLKDSVFSVKLESVYAFFYQIFMKIILPTYLAANLNAKAHESLKLVQSWPSCIELDPSGHRLLVIGRFTSQLVIDQVGISGMGYFLITKGFLVTLVSGLITYEVIILQFQAASLASTK